MSNSKPNPTSTNNKGDDNVKSNMLNAGNHISHFQASFLSKICPKETWKEQLSLVSTALTFIAVMIAVWQLIDMNHSEKINCSYQAVQKLTTSVVIKNITDFIFKGTEGGTNYERALTDEELKHNILQYLNFLEFIAESVNTNRYDESVIYNNLLTTIYKHVSAHIYGKSGSLGKYSWITNSKEQPLFCETSDYPELKELYKKWFPEGEFVNNQQ